MDEVVSFSDIARGACGVRVIIVRCHGESERVDLDEDHLAKVLCSHGRVTFGDAFVDVWISGGQ